MKQDDKELMLKDLCCRLPYGVKAYVKNWSKLEGRWIEGVYTIKSIYPAVDSIFVSSNIGSVEVILESDSYEIQPYLFPLSSMTDEQRKELEELGLGFYVTCQDIDDDGYMWDEKVFQIIPCTETDDWMNAHHFDYRGLIEKSLALDATGLNIY